MNYSAIDYPEDRIWIRLPDWEIAVKIIAFIPVLIFGLYGNFVMLQLIVLNRVLRTPTNMLVANMAVADILTLLLCPIMFMINDFYQNYQLGCVGCKTEGFLDVAFLIAAVLNLSAVSYDRLTAIVLPSETRLTMRGVKIVIIITWLGGFLFALPLALYRSYKVRQWKNFRETACLENPHILPKYWYVLITVMVWVPLSIMVVCYTAIFIKLERYEKRNLSREHPLSISYKKTVAKMVFIVLIAFIALRLPFTILVLLQVRYTTSDYGRNSSFSIYWYISQFLMFVNAAVNPIIYGFNNDKFKRAYDQTPLCSCFKGKEDIIEAKKSSRCNVGCVGNATKWILQLICCGFCFRTKKEFSPAGERVKQMVCDTTNIPVEADETRERNLQDVQCHSFVLSEDFI